MKIPGSKKQKPGKRTLMSKEFFIGLLTLLLGGYNLLTNFKFIPGEPANSAIFQLIGNILLVIAGLLLWFTAYKLSRYKYHTSRIF